MRKLLVMVLLLQACTSKSQLQALPSNAAELAFGDSLTLGRGVDSRYSYPALLGQISELEVVNPGIAGELSN